LSTFINLAETARRTEFTRHVALKEITCHQNDG